MTETNGSTIQLLRHLKLLATKPNDNDPCPKDCNDWYTGKFKGQDGCVFRCHKCKSTKSIRQNSFFAKSHLPLRTIFELIYYWAHQDDSLEKLKRELEIKSGHTIINWRNFCRDICAAYYVNNSQKIGGPGHIVEIDESWVLVQFNHSIYI